MTVQITAMTANDFDEVNALWQRTEGVGLSPSDSEERVVGFLKRNHGLSLVARHEDRIVGAVLCGHDGRRGYLYHLAVAPSHRSQGLGRRLVETCLKKLAEEAILKATIVVYGRNDTGQEFWRHIGWGDRTDLIVLQKETR
jgi:ribosomal protein S18 acetylase RimI-like enzyme